MGTAKRALARWGLACGGPITGSLAIAGLLAVGVPALLGGEVRTATVDGPTRALDAPDRVREPAPPVPTDDAEPRRTTPRRPRVVPVAPPVSGDVLAGSMPQSELQDIDAQMSELDWEQGNMFKQIVDAKYAFHGIDTTMLTFEEITGGRQLRGRAKYLERKARLDSGVGGAPPEEDSDSDWSEFPEARAPEDAKKDPGALSSGPVESGSEESAPLGK